ncbi:MAG: acyl-CoA dehydrogenase family protein [Alphaproteobacteria bacterium]
MAIARQDSATPPTLDEILQRAEGLLPALRERAAEAEKLRRLPDATVKDLYATGMMRLLQPKRYGGYEMDWAAHAEAARVIARACSSTAWVVAVVGAHAAILARMPKQCQDEVWGPNQDQIIATASARKDGTARQVDGGYIVTGTWRFASGVDHADWCMVPAPVEASERGLHDAPGFLRVLMPKGDYEIQDTWFVSGVKASGSKDVHCDEVFVPDYRVMDSRATFAPDPPGAAVNPEHYLYRLEFGPYFGSSLLGPMLGAAEGAYADYRDMTAVREGALFGGKVAAMVQVQQRLAESAAEIKAARLVYESNNRLLHERGSAGKGLNHEEMLEMNRDRAFVAKLLIGAVTRLVRQMGAMGLYDDNPVQRHYRDISAMGTQIAVNWDRNVTPFGKSELGLDAETLGFHRPKTA